MDKKTIRFNVTRPGEKISGAVALEQERVFAGEARQKHLALEYFVCFAVDEHDRPLPRSEVEALFKIMSEIEIRLALHRLNSALQEQNLMLANQLIAPIPIMPDAIPPARTGKRARKE